MLCQGVIPGLTLTKRANSKPISHFCLFDEHVNTGTPASSLSLKKGVVYHLGDRRYFFFPLVHVYRACLLSKKNVLSVVRSIAVAPGFQGGAHPVIARVVFLGRCRLIGLSGIAHGDGTVSRKDLGRLSP